MYCLLKLCMWVFTEEHDLLPRYQWYQSSHDSFERSLAKQTEKNYKIKRQCVSYMAKSICDKSRSFTKRWKNGAGSVFLFLLWSCRTTPISFPPISQGKELYLTLPTVTSFHSTVLLAFPPPPLRKAVCLFIIFTSPSFTSAPQPHLSNVSLGRRRRVTYKVFRSLRLADITILSGSPTTFSVVGSLFCPR